MALLRTLHNETGRLKQGRYFIEGDELIRRAIDFKTGIECVIMTDTFASTGEGEALASRASAAGATAFSASAGLLSTALGAKPTPKCVAILPRKTVKPADIFKSGRSLIQMVENGENADNLGMLLRTVDAAGAGGTVLAGNTVDPFNRRTIRGSRGAVFSLPICVVEDPAKAIAEAKAHGFKVIATSVRGKKDYTQVDLTGSVMIIVGNEHVGISKTVSDLSDHLVRIPMKGRVPSLNIAVAASIMLYEAVRQRTC